MSSRSAELADPVGAVFILTIAQFAEQMAAQSAAQISAFSSMMSRFEEMQAALSQTQADTREAAIQAE